VLKLRISIVKYRWFGRLNQVSLLSVTQGSCFIRLVLINSSCILAEESTNTL
jgi:hypothetical protein